MIRIHMVAHKRVLQGKGYLHQLRREGKVPGVVHVHGGTSVPVYLEEADLKKAVGSSAGMNALLDLDIQGDGKGITLIERLERDTMKPERILHVDLRRVAIHETVHVHVPVVVDGLDRRKHDGGILSHSLFEIPVESTPDTMPGRIHVDVSMLKIGDTILVRDLMLPKGCRWLIGANEPVVGIIHSRVTMPEETAEPEPAPRTTPAATIPSGD
ncbi:MAG: 50S ribosomal protein L25 [Clostridia bacterium]|nr:50S ribosomal protein L25 [Clostridia bacterium]